MASDNPCGLQKRTPNLLEAFAVFMHVVASQRFSIVCVDSSSLQHKATRPAVTFPGAPNRKTAHRTRFAIRQNPCSKPALGGFPFLRVTNPKSLDSRSQRTIARRLSLKFARIALACLRILLFRLTKRCCRVFANGYHCLVSDVLALE